MSREQVVEYAGRHPEVDAAPLDLADRLADRRLQPFGVWLTSFEATAYVGSKSVKAYYEWRKRRGLFTDRFGRVSRRDLDRALRTPRKRQVMSPVSLANLRRRHGQQSAPTSTVPSACEG